MNRIPARLPRRGLALVLLLVLCGVFPRQTLRGDDAAIVVNPETATWLTENNFNQYVFNQTGMESRGGRGVAATMRTQLTDLAAAEIAMVERMFAITAPQKRKLELAARGDINRMFEQIDAARKHWLTQRHTRDEFQTFWKDAQKLQILVTTDRFGAGSMYRKMLVGTLNPDQAAQYFAAERSRRERRHRARVAATVSYLESMVPFDTSQRQRLSELIEKETENMVDCGRYQTYVILYRTSRIPEAKLKTVLDPVQLRTFVERLRGYQGAGRWLEQQGLLRDQPRDEDLYQTELTRK